MYKFCFHVPESHLEITKQAVFDAGAGRHGNYERCCWETRGRGQFRALAGSEPFLGQVSELETVEEYLVEMVCNDTSIRDAVEALKESHPYETPAFSVTKLEDF
jgi:hypothetical protein